MAPLAAAAAAAAALPVGLILSEKHKIKIGQLIGKGEFGEVYAVEGVGKKSWVVKVVRVPKIEYSAAGIASLRLYHESLTYTNCRKWSGSLIPLLPYEMTDKIDSYYEDVDGTCGGSPFSCWSLPDPPRQKSLTRT
jgi:serine/threonine protein kinase